MIAHVLLLLVSVTVILDGYSGNATLDVIGKNFSASYDVHNGSVLQLEPGNYEFRLYAMNKTFVKRLNVTGEEAVTFNMRFTNSTKNIEIFYHTLIFASNGIAVSEVLIFNNTGDENFEGDVAIPMPGCEDLRIESSSLSYVDAEFLNGSLVFKDLLIPADGGGQITLSYRLKENIFERNGTGAKFVIFTSLGVESFEGLRYEGNRSFGGTNFDVYGGEDSYYRLVLAESRGISFNPFAAVGIALASAAVFLYFRERSGGWSI